MTKKKKKTALEIEEMVEKGESISEYLPKKLEAGFHKKNWLKRKLLEQRSILAVK